MDLRLELALRFLRRRTGPLLRGTASAALAGVALATAALVITLALMTGYSKAIATALQRGNAHIVGFAIGQIPLDEANELARRAAAVDGVVRASPVTYLSALLDDPGEPTRPLPVTIKAVEDPPAFSGFESWPHKTAIPAVVGERLAAKINAREGSILLARLPPENGSWVLPTLTFEVVGTFRLAFAEFDEQWIVVPLDSVIVALPGTGAAGVEIELADPLAVEGARDRLAAANPSLYHTDWREMNRAMFAAMRWQTISLFVVLCLVVAVAAFQVSSALVVLTIDKQKTTGMLQALGATPRVIRHVLMLAGVALGGAGVALGIAVGCLASWLGTAMRVVRFPPGLARVYMVDSIPLVPTVAHLAAVALVCFVLVLGASIGPAWKASRLDPVAALRAV